MEARDKYMTIFEQKKFYLNFSFKFFFPISGHENPGSGKDPDRYST
jgi:hypothetical protein